MGQVKAMGSERILPRICDERATRKLFPARPDKPLVGDQRRGCGGGWRLVVFLALVWTGCRVWAQVPRVAQTSVYDVCEHR